MMNAVLNSPLIGVLGWKDFYKTSIEISLFIILYLNLTCKSNFFIF